MIPERLLPVVDETAQLAERFATAGHHIYLVGGTVRDAIAGPPSGGVAFGPESDIDLTTDALPDEIEALIGGWAEAVWTQGKRFGTIGALHAGRRFEITTHRAEVYLPESRKPEVRFGRDVISDLSRRDFTVNAMAVSLPAIELIDPFDGLEDLAARRLRTPLDATTSFSDDPLRMLRAARFISAYGLQPVDGVIEAVKELAERLSIVSAERIRDELDRLIVLPDPEPGLWFVVRSGLADRFLPELPALELEQDAVHRHKDVLAHTIAVVGKTRPDKILRLAALLHDIGKPRTRAIGPGGVTFHHHDVVGARMARARLEALHYPNEQIEAITRLVELHLRFHTYKMGWTDSALRRYARDAGPLLGRLNELTRADCTTRNVERALELEARVDEVEARLAELQAREALDAIRPELDGNAVMARLGIPPGPDVGRALDYLMEVRLDEGLLGEEAVGRRLDAWWAVQGAEEN
ncbi:MAG TPA: CCA tRNA nucleotidyltransferase [Acidimicrobiales bacterium]|nr:CCA tRNA nucleotidyltransferase [Acidimicrobiales bacterium]